MPQTRALIHTSAIFLTRETMMQDMFREIMPNVRLINIMDDSLLPDCMGVGGVTPETTRRMCAYVMAAEAARADAVLSLCSSLGPAIDTARNLVRVPVIKIDDAHTEKAAKEANRIGVMATVKSTLVPTVALVREKADSLGKPVEIVESLSGAAFDALMRGDREQHDATVLAAAQELAPRVDLLLFAQASMTRLAPVVQEATGLRVLTSPRLAIEYTKQVLDRLRDTRTAAV